MLTGLLCKPVRPALQSNPALPWLHGSRAPPNPEQFSSGCTPPRVSMEKSIALGHEYPDIYLFMADPLIWMGISLTVISEHRIRD